jgi:5-methylcytosine-specific restriction endonuclease McrA
VAGKQGGPWGAEKALRMAFSAHGGACFYCAKVLAEGEMTVDHVEPQKLNGGDSLQNLVLACKPCNAAKAHKPIEAFKPEAGKAWLNALLKQIEDRLKRLD